MLHSLFVKNFALIEELHFNPEAGLNVVTGETGAGKSIILGALGLVLGNRAENAALLHLTEKCIVEAVFSSNNKRIDQFFRDKELDLEKEIILRREISVSGKSRAFINDTPVMLTDLKELGSMLIEIHTQNTTLLIKEAQEQLHLVDDFGTPKEILEQQQLLWDTYADKRKQLDILEQQINKALAERDYLQFQFDELDKFGPVAGEDETLVQRANALAHAAEISESSLRALDMLTEAEDSAYSKLQSVRAALRGIVAYHGDVAAVSEKLEQVILDIKDLGNTLQKPSENSEQNPEQLEYINSRLASLQMLLRKHQVNDSSELLEIYGSIGKKLEIADNAEGEKMRLQIAVDESFSDCLRGAEQLHTIRERLAEDLCRQAVSQLQKLGMPKAKLQAQISFNASNLGSLGASKVQLLFNANGSKELPLEKVASGGEVSRLNFCFKSILAGKKSLATIIFDEADTGVSGEIALRFGEMMHEMGKFHQIITITHLPQVAAKGKTHFEVYKVEKNHVTNTRMRKLSETEKIANIAGMLGGNDPGEAALATAKELLGI